MVATRGTDQVVAFVTGQEKIDASEIQTEEWVKILRAAVAELPLNYLRGLKSIKQILHYDGPGVHHEVEGPLPRLLNGSLWHRDQALDASKEIRANEVFLDCGSSGEDFPRSWTEARRGVTDKILPVQTGNYLLSRDKKLYYLKARWNPREEWDDKSLSSSPVRFWYGLDMLNVGIGEMDDRRLFEFLAGGGLKSRTAEIMLQRFHLALSETASDVRGQYDHILAKKQVMAGYLDRIGRLAT